VSRLIAISHNSVIAEHVRSIVWTGAMYDKEEPNLGAKDVQNVSSILAKSQCETMQRDSAYLLRIKDILSRFRRLEKLTILEDRPVLSLNRRTTDSTSDCGQKLELIQAGISNNNIQMTQLSIEWLNTTFFHSRAALIGHVWKPLSILRLGIMQVPESHGLGGLKTFLCELVNLRQLQLACGEDSEITLDSIFDRREVPWNHLSDLSLHGFVTTEPTLQWLLEIPTLEKIALECIGLPDNDCWIRTLTRLHNRGSGGNIHSHEDDITLEG
jgi:hypothetical protein